MTFFFQEMNIISLENKKAAISADFRKGYDL